MRSLRARSSRCCHEEQPRGREVPGVGSQESRSRARFLSHDDGIGVKAVLLSFHSRRFECLTFYSWTPQRLLPNLTPGATCPQRFSLDASTC